MKVNKRSRTAETTAIGRAVHLIRHAEPKIFEDPYAIRFISRFCQWGIRSRLLYWFFTRNFILGWTRPNQGKIVCRSRYAEERFELALNAGVTQYVLLSAGLDSFALRRPDLTKLVTVFEVDHPATQQWKLERLSKLGIDPPKNVIYIPVDFEMESLVEALSKSSFSNDKQAFFSWLGATHYISKDTVFNIIQSIASCATKGSEIVFDYYDAEAFTEICQSETVKRLIKWAAHLGEPIITGFDHEELVDELRKLGLEIVESLTPAEQQKRYFTGRPDGLTPLQYAHFLCARIT